MNAATRKRCEQLGEEAKRATNRWIEDFPNDYRGKVCFALAIATAVGILSRITPGLQNTGADFVAAVKAGTILWVEEGEPTTMKAVSE